jgi:hypothetical protein
MSDSKLKINGPKGRMMNFLTSFNFIFYVSKKLMQLNPYNLASLYLFKFNYAELAAIKTYLEKKENFLGLDNWK